MSKVLSYSLFTDFDISLFKSGKHYRLFEEFGAHITTLDGVSVPTFLFGPQVPSLFLLLETNHCIAALKLVGFYEFGRFYPHVGKGSVYKHSILSLDILPEKAILMLTVSFSKNSFHCMGTKHDWKDNDWMLKRKQNNSLSSPFSVYEVHLDSWSSGNGVD